MDQHYISIDAPPKNKSVNSFMEKLNQFKAENSPTYIDDL
jgi:wyosine [tRNA(Phe)-imidazoG37] synthetase (radical SAM superfamily)